jgi:[CysO sulfur-carrier protein]-S-L-cysteine hydrolase
VILPREIRDQLIEHARAEAPRECCGIIGTLDGRALEIFRAANAAPNPEYGYAIDGIEEWRITVALEVAGLELGAIYHSHIHAPPAPSESDIRLAAHPEALYVIIGPGLDPDIRAWRIVDGQVSEEPLASGDSRGHAPPPGRPRARLDR